MARTRNLNPGRVSTLHYAFTVRKRHAKRLVYAYLLLLGLPVAARAGEQAAGPDSSAVPCVACLALSVGAEQAGILPSDLNGLRVLVRVEPRTPLPAVRPLLDDIARRGGRP